MFRKKRTINRAKAVIYSFCFIVLLTVLLQIWSMLQQHHCVQNERGSKYSSENRFLDQIWAQMEVSGSCIGPTFSSLHSWKHDTSSSIANTFILSMNCSHNPKYSFTFTNNPSLQLDYPNYEVHIPNSPPSTSMPREYIRAICPSVPYFPSTTAWTNVFSMHTFNKKAEERATKILKQRQQLNTQEQEENLNLKPLNVILLSISALSEPHFHRTMPKTSKYLKALLEQTERSTTQAKTHAFHYEKYHAVATTTMRNQISLFTGLSSHNRDFSQTEAYKLWLDESDSHSQRAEWLWSHYKRNGYVTMFSEEHCIIPRSIRHLFSSQTPIIDDRFTDLYCQFAADPFQGQIPSNSRSEAFINVNVTQHMSTPTNTTTWFQEQQTRQKDGWRYGSSCVGNKFIHSLLLEYIDQFIGAYKTPYFAPAIFMEAFEPTRTRIKTLDESMLLFLQHLEQKGVFKDTMIVLTSDQGLLDIPSEFSSSMMVSPKQSTSLELQYPFLYLLVPPAIAQHYPQSFDALKSNQLSLTTTLDLYSTLRRFTEFTVPEDTTHTTNSDTQQNPMANAILDRTFSHSFEYRENDKFLPVNSVSLLDEIIIPKRGCNSAGVPNEMCRCNRTMIAPNMILPLSLFIGFSFVILLWWFYSWCT